MVRESNEDLRLGKFQKGNVVFVGKVVGDEVLESSTPCMTSVIEKGFKPNGARHDLASLKILAPVDRPTKIVCIGLNYRTHIKEMGSKIPESPIIFMKPSSSIIGPGQDIVLPKMSSRVDYEGESAIVIGRRASHAKNGNEHIFGFTCFNDVTARDLQKIDPDWTRAKGFDTFAPTGPFISSRKPTVVRTILNAKTVQQAPLSDRVFDDSQLIEYVSSIMVLEPGDMIATGTPSGISPMKHGDIVEIELDGIGRLRNQVV